MKNKMDSKNALESLARVRWQCMILFLIAAALLAFDPHYRISILIIALALYWDWKKYRCPHCDKNLDARMKLDDYTHCPYCGKVISVAKK